MRNSTLRFSSCLLALLLFPAFLAGADFGESVQYFADLATGGGAVTEFTIHNPTAQATSVRLELFSSGGQSLGDMSVEVAASGTAAVRFGQPSDPLQVGWARLSSAGKFRATEFFQIALGQVTLPRVGVLPSALSDSARVFCFISPAGVDTGLAIANPSQTDTVTLTAKLYDTAGTLARTQTITLEPHRHLAQFLTEEGFFPGLVDFQGTAEITASKPVIMVSLRSDSNQLSSVSVLTPIVDTALTPGSVTTQMLADSAVTGTKIANGAVVRSINGLTDQVQLLAGANVSVQQVGQTLLLSATGTSADITGVTAGDGLTGGGSSGDVTIGIAPNGVQGSMIDSGEVVKSINGAHDDLTLAAGANISVNRAGQTITIAGTGASGDITGVTAGNGLSGGGSAGEVTLSIANPLLLGTSAGGGPAIALQRSTIFPMVALGVNSSNQGAIGLGSGSSQLPLVAMGSVDGGPAGKTGKVSVFRGNTQIPIVTAEELSNGGSLSVMNSLGIVTASMNGATGAITGVSKSFLVDDPTDPSRRIRYTSIEGPEAAMYVRGTAQLVNGRAFIDLPDHFKALAAEGTISVTLTPRSPASLGLAAADVSLNGIQVSELFGGSGAYGFDYVIYAVRKGYEDYQVYEAKPAPSAEADALGAAIAGELNRSR